MALFIWFDVPPDQHYRTVPILKVRAVRARHQLEIGGSHIGANFSGQQSHCVLDAKTYVPVDVFYAKLSIKNSL